MRPAPRPGSTRSPTSSNNTDHSSRRTAMAAARHKMPPEIASLSLQEIAERYIGRFRDKIPDWEAFEDAKIDGYRRAQHRFIGAGGSGKHDDPSVIPPRAFTLSVIYLPAGPGQRRAYA